MASHVIIDSGHTVILDNGGYGGIPKVKPGCAVCGAEASFCETHPNCPGEARYSIATHDQKTKSRQRKRKKK